jgi:Ca2+-binding EF-hand superfamily protein
VLDENRGLALLDVTEPARPTVLFPIMGQRSESRGRGELSFRGLVLATHVDVAELQGGQRTYERNYAYVLAERTRNNGQARSTLQVFDLENPRAPRRTGSVEAGYATEMLSPGAFYNPPFLQRILFSPGELGVYVTDASLSNEPDALGALPGLTGTYAIEVESFPLDRMRDAAGRPLKDVSHPGSRWLNLPEIERVLAVSGEELGLVEPGSAAPELVGQLARLQLEARDADRSGFLEVDESPASLMQSADVDGDLHLSLLELGEYAAVFRARGTRAEEASPIADRAARTGPDGDLARLLDGVDPADFDRDRDGALDRGEAERACFAALDLDGDKGLSLSELSRYPGPRRALRFGGTGTNKLFRQDDRDGSGAVSVREFSLADAEWSVLDEDGDGEVGLRPDPTRTKAKAIVRPGPPEWPYRRGGSYALPPVTTADALFARLDRNGNGEIPTREIERIPGLALLDANGDGRIALEELQAVVTRIEQAGVEVTRDDFEGRWDLDGDGTVEADEIPLPAWLRGRVLGPRR